MVLLVKEAVSETVRHVSFDLPVRVFTPLASLHVKRRLSAPRTLCLAPHITLLERQGLKRASAE